MKLNIALLQLSGSPFDPAANADLAASACRQARARGADIAVMPEMFSTAYAGVREFGHEEDWARVRAASQPADGPFVSRFRSLARELDMAIVATFSESSGGRLYNSAALIRRDGALLGVYRKVHTCRFINLEYGYAAGDDLPVWDLETASGPVKVGLLICYDREFPEPCRILMLKGAELVLVPNACLLEPRRLEQFRARAFENSAACAMANYYRPAKEKIVFNGHSIAVDANGVSIAEAGEEETVLLAEVDIEAVRERQLNGNMANAWRRPELYSLLTRPGLLPGRGCPDAAEADRRKNAGEDVSRLGLYNVRELKAIHHRGTEDTENA